MNPIGRLDVPSGVQRGVAMSSLPNRSLIRLIVGLVGLTAALIIALLIIPDATRSLEQEKRAKANAQAALTQRLQELKEFQDLATQIQQGRERLESLERNMPQGSIGTMQWTLSKTLHELAQKHGVRLQAVKYGLPNREGAKGTDLEAMDVEFNVSGIYENLKPFMLALEGSDLPFAVSSVRLEESPDGARLTVTLRAFRKGAPAMDEPREEA